MMAFFLLVPSFAGAKTGDLTPDGGIELWTDGSVVIDYPVKAGDQVTVDFWTDAKYTAYVSVNDVLFRKTGAPGRYQVSGVMSETADSMIIKSLIQSQLLYVVLYAVYVNGDLVWNPVDGVVGDPGGGGTNPDPDPEPEPEPEPEPDLAPPTGLAYELQGNELHLSWDEHPDPRVVGYHVYIGLDKRTSQPILDTAFVIPGMMTGTYNVFVTAVTSDGKESSPAKLTITVLIDPPGGEEPEPQPLNMVLLGNMDSVVVQVSGGTPPYEVSWDVYGVGGSDVFDASRYVISGLGANQVVTVTVTDSDGNSVTQTVNTGTQKSFIPPVMPNIKEAFQRAIDLFGNAGHIGVAILLAAVALGVIIVLGIWAWRLTKKWISAAR